jgi:hypothetical protein
VNIEIDLEAIAIDLNTLSVNREQQSADGTCPEDNRKLNQFEIESDEQCEQWLLPETIAIGARSIQSEHKAKNGKKNKTAKTF